LPDQRVIAAGIHCIGPQPTAFPPLVRAILDEVGGAAEGTPETLVQILRRAGQAPLDMASALGGR
jgi:hypothetical protein